MFGIITLLSLPLLAQHAIGRGDEDIRLGVVAAFGGHAWAHALVFGLRGDRGQPTMPRRPT
jgi:hypothetical protein